MSMLTRFNGYAGTSYKNIASVTTRREVISASYKPLGNIIAKTFSTITFERQKKLILYRLRKSGNVISFGEYFKRTGGIKRSEKFLAQDDKGIVFEKLPNFVVDISYLKPVEFKKKGNPTPLHIAVKKKNIAEIKRLLSNGADVNAPGIGGKTPLFDAVKTGSLRVVNLLMSQAADPNKYETVNWNYNITAYHYALILKFYAITKLFIEKWGVAPNQSVRSFDYAPPEAIDFARASEERLQKMTPFKREETKKILLLLLLKKYTKTVDPALLEKDFKRSEELHKTFSEY